MITREADYAMRVLLLLAQRVGEGAGGASSLEIAGEMDIPYRFLRKLVKRMVVGKLVCSRRGKGGGLALARSPERISLFDVLEVMAPTGTYLSLCVAESGSCRRAGTCRVFKEISVIQSSVNRQLKAISLASLVG